MQIKESCMAAICSAFNSSSVGYILRKAALNPRPSFKAQISSINQKNTVRSSASVLICLD